MQIQLSLFNLQADSTGRREETCLHSPAATYFKNQQDGKSCCANESTLNLFLVMAQYLTWTHRCLIWLRMMMHCVRPLFEKRGFQFHCEYVEKIRQWNETLPNFSTTSLGSQSKHSETTIGIFILNKLIIARTHSVVDGGRSSYLHREISKSITYSSHKVWRIQASLNGRWESGTPQLHMDSSGAQLDRKLVVKSFFLVFQCFVACDLMVRWDMTAALLGRADDRLPAQFQPHACDVFMLIKAFVSDRELCQDPLIVYPGDKQALAKNAFTRLARGHAPCQLAQLFVKASFQSLQSHWTWCSHLGTARELSEAAKYDFKRLANYLQKNYTTYNEGSRYLLQLAGEIAVPQGPLPTIQLPGKNIPEWLMVNNN